MIYDDNMNDNNDMINNNEIIYYTYFNDFS